MLPYSESVTFNQSRNKRSIIELLAKILIGLAIAGFLAAILIILIIRLPINNNIATSQEKEVAIKLLITSNERIAELQRELEVNLDKTRQVHMDEYRQEDNLLRRSEQMSQRNLTYEFLQRIEESAQKNRKEEREYQQEIEQQRAAIAGKYRGEDQDRQNENDLDEFLNKYNLTNTPRSILEQKILNLLRRFNNQQKSSLIKILYKENLLRKDCNTSNNILPCYLDLKGADLNGIQLGDKYLTSPEEQYNYLYLPRTNLMNASFNYISLHNADFTGADLNNADFSSINMNNASFNNARLYDISLLFTDMNMCNFQDAKMNRINLFSSSILNSQFQRASLTQSKFILFKGNGSDFRESNLAQSSLAEAILTGAKFDYAIMSEISLNSAHLENASFYKVNGDKGDFWGTHLTNTDFRNASLRLAEFLIAEGNQTDFSEANLDGANLRYIHLKEALFHNTSMKDVSLQYARIIDSNLRHAMLIEADFYLADLTGSDFSEANLNRSKELTEDQLDTVFSISGAILPNGTKGKNKNLVKHGNPLCTNSAMTMNISEWTMPSQILVINTNNTCGFRSTVPNLSTMSQSIDISDYVMRMMNAGPTNILVEIDIIFGKTDANINLFDSMNNPIDQRTGNLNDTMNKSISIKYRIIDPTIVRAELVIRFLEMNTAINNIHLSIEV